MWRGGIEGGIEGGGNNPYAISLLHPIHVAFTLTLCPIPLRPQDMFVNLVNKYGLVPKAAYPESATSGASRPLNWIITSKLREFASVLRAQNLEGKSIDDLRALKEKQLEEIFRILVIFLGEPPKTFEFRYKNKDKETILLDGLTPLQFAKEHVAFDVSFDCSPSLSFSPLLSFPQLCPHRSALTLTHSPLPTTLISPLQPTDYVSLINDPRNSYNQLYTVDRLGNIKGGQPVLYANVDIDTLKKYTRKVLESGKPVWFGCDVGYVYFMYLCFFFFSFSFSLFTFFFFFFFFFLFLFCMSFLSSPIVSRPPSHALPLSLFPTTLANSSTVERESWTWTSSVMTSCSTPLSTWTRPLASGTGKVS